MDYASDNAANFEFHHCSPSGHSLPPVKSEASASPGLPPALVSHWLFQLRSQPTTSSEPSQVLNRPPLRSDSSLLLPPSPSSLPPHLGLAFHPDQRHSSMDHHPWNPSAIRTTTSSHHHHHSNRSIRHTPSDAAGDKFDLSSVQHTMSFSDEYDDGQDLVELSPHEPSVGALNSSSSDKIIRRRSSKACDQCRKSKCKCERTTASGDPCRSCVMLGIPCTFLGPSRKRGPPKGYIDAIEARLHQTEALVGIMLSYNDERARSLLHDLAQDSFARQVIHRVDNSVYGVKGRQRAENNQASKARQPSSSPGIGPSSSSEHMDIQSTHPSNEWQDKVVNMLRSQKSRLQYENPDQNSDPHPAKPSLRIVPPDTIQDNHRRQRRRLAAEDAAAQEDAQRYDTAAQRDDIDTRSPYSAGSGTTSHRSSRSPRSISQVIEQRRQQYHATKETPPSSPIDSAASGSDLMGAVGQLSLNEEEQVRYHGKASGLHLLGVKERIDDRNQGGIWRFPKARVWPPLPPDAQSHSSIRTDESTDWPDPAIQDHLLELYFAYAHPSLPVIHKQAFLEAYKPLPTADSPESDSRSSTSSPRRSKRIPPLLLYSMLAIAARFTSQEDSGIPPPPAHASTMWAAGDEYLDRAKILLDHTYASSKPSTCQALLLMGYREIGIGAMAEAWTFIGMAIRMAQDLGMHRSADSWARANLGGRLFSEMELQERKRIWYACVIMDKYVSTYIGRPVGIFEKDYDTPLPSTDDIDEVEPWCPHPSKPLIVSSWPKSETKSSNPSRIISCFNTSAKLAGLLSHIVQIIYAVRPLSSRRAQCASLNEELDRWYCDLPGALRHDPLVSQVNSPADVPLPHVLILHMQYWCAVLLLHRPFIRNLVDMENKRRDEADDTDKSYELCATAANHITSIVSLYMVHYCLKRSPVFLCYYVFTASIMHATTLSAHPSDSRALRGLAKCMQVLEDMEIVWPSASRALQLLRGSKMNRLDSPASISMSITASDAPAPRYHEVRTAVKRPAEHALPDTVGRGHIVTSPSPRVTAAVSNYDSVSLRNPHATATSFAVAPPPYDHHSASSTDIYDHPSGVDLQHAPSVSPTPPVVSTSYYPSYPQRWPSALDSPVASHSDENTLSSVVASQIYSTGIVDNRSFVGRSQMMSSQQPASMHRRYTVSSPQQQQQQYWAEQPSNATPSHYGTTTSSYPDIPAFLPEQYNMYNNHPASGT